MATPSSADSHAASLAFVAPVYGGETLGRPVPDDAPAFFTALVQDDALLHRVVEGLYSDWTASAALPNCTSIAEDSTALAW